MVKIRAHVFVSGRVQGVFFRQTTKEIAERIDVGGWVRNLPDARVEAVFEGDEQAVKTIVEYCHHGSYGAKVTDVEVSWERFVGEFSDFDAR